MTTIQPPAQQPTAPPQPTPQPSNGLAVAALVLGIVTVALSPLPILNQAGILVGIVGVLLAIPAFIVGLVRHHRVVMAVIGFVLSVLGLISSFAFTNHYVHAIDDAFKGVGTTNSGGVISAPSIQPNQTAAPRTITFTLQGSAKRADVNFSMDGSSGSDEVTVPWTKTMTSTRDGGYTSISANTPMGSKGNITCRITDETGAVLAEQTAASQGGEYGSAMVNCSAF